MSIGLSLQFVTKIIINVLELEVAVLKTGRHEGCKDRLREMMRMSLLKILGVIVSSAIEIM